MGVSPAEVGDNEYCSILGPKCYNPPAWKKDGKVTSNTEPPRTRMRCVKCNEPACYECRNGRNECRKCSPPPAKPENKKTEVVKEKAITTTNKKDDKKESTTTTKKSNVIGFKPKELPKVDDKEVEKLANLMWKKVCDKMGHVNWLDVCDEYRWMARLSMMLREFHLQENPIEKEEKKDDKKDNKKEKVGSGQAG